MEENVIIVGLVVAVLMWDKLLRHRLDMAKLKSQEEETPEKVKRI